MWYTLGFPINLLDSNDSHLNVNCFVGGCLFNKQARRKLEKYVNSFRTHLVQHYLDTTFFSQYCSECLRHKAHRIMACGSLKRKVHVCLKSYETIRSLLCMISLWVINKFITYHLLSEIGFEVIFEIVEDNLSYKFFELPPSYQHFQRTPWNWNFFSWWHQHNMNVWSHVGHFDTSTP